MQTVYLLIRQVKGQVSFTSGQQINCKTNFKKFAEKNKHQAIFLLKHNHSKLEEELINRSGR